MLGTMSDSSEPAQSETVTARFQTLRGMHDILPEDAGYYRQVEAAFWKTARQHGFQEIRTPVLESTDLFVRTSGASSDIVHKEMYTFSDRSDHSVSLRPEGTAGVARAYLEHGMFNRPQPIKLAYQNTQYRYERPQAGRFREHEQVGLECFGSDDPSTDAEIILAVWQMLGQLDLQAGVSVQVNSIGDAASRRAIRTAITKTLQPVADRLPEDAQRQLQQNPLRVLDSKDPAVTKYVAEIPPLIDQLTAVDREHFTAVLEYLDEVAVPYELNSRLVRGLDYYTRTVFEFWSDHGGQSALASGGRYDHLISEIGGPETPGVGVGCGVDRMVALLKERATHTLVDTHPQVFVVQLGDVAKKISFRLSSELTAAGVSVTSALGRDSIRSQLKLADKLQAPLALIIGQKEAMEGSIIVRDMASGVQDTVALDDVVAEVRRRIPSEVTKR